MSRSTGTTRAHTREGTSMSTSTVTETPRKRVPARPVPGKQVTSKRAPRKQKAVPASIAHLVVEPDWKRKLAGTIATDFTVREMSALLTEREPYDIARLAAKNEATEEQVELALDYILAVRTANIPNWFIALAES